MYGEEIVQGCLRYSATYYPAGGHQSLVILPLNEAPDDYVQMHTYRPEEYYYVCFAGRDITLVGEISCDKINTVIFEPMRQLVWEQGRPKKAMSVTDGEQWNMSFSYKDKKFAISGANFYPNYYRDIVGGMKRLVLETLLGYDKLSVYEYKKWCALCKHASKEWFWLDEDTKRLHPIRSWYRQLHHGLAPQPSQVLNDVDESMQKLYHRHIRRQKGWHTLTDELIKESCGYYPEEIKAYEKAEKLKYKAEKKAWSEVEPQVRCRKAFSEKDKKAFAKYTSFKSKDKETSEWTEKDIRSDKYVDMVFWFADKMAETRKYGHVRYEGIVTLLENLDTFPFASLIYSTDERDFFGDKKSVAMVVPRHLQDVYVEEKTIDEFVVFLYLYDFIAEGEFFHKSFVLSADVVDKYILNPLSVTAYTKGHYHPKDHIVMGKGSHLVVLNKSRRINIESYDAWPLGYRNVCDAYVNMLLVLSLDTTAKSDEVQTCFAQFTEACYATDRQGWSPYGPLREMDPDKRNYFDML